MKTPENTQPFNLAHTKAGAPVICRDGSEAAVLKFDARGDFPLVGVTGRNDIPYSWTAHGTFYGRDEIDSRLDLFMAPLGLLDGKPVFVGYEIEGYSPDGWVHILAHPAHPDFTNCRWPAPKRAYPETLMNDHEVKVAYLMCPGDLCESRLAIANAALRHAIDAGQLFDKSDVDAAYNRGLNEGIAAQVDLMKVAEAVRAAAYKVWCDTPIVLSGPAICNIDIATIIATVKD